MADNHLIEQLLALPLPDRVELAQKQSIDDGSCAGTPDVEREAVEQAKRRDAELTSGAVVGRSHEEVIQAALN